MIPSLLFRRLAPIIVVAIGLVLLIEFAFRQGAWELLARPESNAGQSVRLKRAVHALGAEKLQFITLGDSRSVYGIDHKRIADAAGVLGLRHHNLSLAGMHWLSTNLAAEWAQREGQHIKGVLIATNYTNFAYLGNGDHELAIAAPLLPTWDTSRLTRSVPFDKKKYCYLWKLFRLVSVPQRRTEFPDRTASSFQRVGCIPWPRSYAANDIICDEP